MTATPIPESSLPQGEIKGWPAESKRREESEVERCTNCKVPFLRHRDAPSVCTFCQSAETVTDVAKGS